MTSFAPVVLFTFNRPKHTAITLDALKKMIRQRNTPLIVYCDGARTPEDLDLITAVVKTCKEIDGFASVTVHQRENNLGLAANIIDGVTTTLQKYDRAIVLEDDIVTSPYFLRFMNDGLDCYEHEHDVISIGGMYQRPAAPYQKPIF